MHRLSDAEWRPTRYTFGTMRPTGICYHETTSGLQKYSCVNYLLSSKHNARKDRRYCYHVVVERDGTCVQLADLTAKLRHAGRSSWGGRMWCNNFMISVGIVGPGPLKGTLEKAKDIYGYTHTDGICAGNSSFHGSGKLWLKPTEAQKRTIDKINAEIMAIFPEITKDNIVTHYQISPGRKIDPPPMNVFDIEALKLGGLENVGEGLERLVHETTHDVKIVRESTPSVLSKQSREYKTAAAIKHTGGATALGVGALETFKHSNVAAAKSYIDLISSFIATYGLLVVGGLGVAALLAGAFLQLWKEESYEEGRYEPSGEANDVPD